jgi:hypothetical protein
LAHNVAGRQQVEANGFFLQIIASNGLDQHMTNHKCLVIMEDFPAGSALLAPATV